MLSSSVQSLSYVQLFATPWTAARQSSLSITNSRSLPKLKFIESVMPSNHLILCRPLLLLPSIFPASGSFPMSQLFTSGGHSVGVSASTSVLPMNTQDWFPLRWTGWIFLQSKELSRVFFNTTVQKHQFFGAQLSLIAVKRREAKNKGEKERYTHLNAESQRIARRDKKAFLSDQCKEIEESNRMGKTRDLFNKIRDTKGTFMQRWVQ